MVSTQQYGNGGMAPGVLDHEYDAAHNLIKAHAKAYKVYDKEFKSTQGGNIFVYAYV